MPVEEAMGLTGPVTQPRNVPLWEERPQGPAPHPSGFVVSSLSHAGVAAAPTTPTPSCPPTPPAQIATPAHTHSVLQVLTSAS